MRRTVLATLPALALAAPASAQDRGEPVVGGGSVHVTLTHPDIGNLAVQHLGVIGLSAPDPQPDADHGRPLQS
jgi:hypothetical protein